jgi:hypothetical protein
MNQSKFSLADVITLLAALAFGFVSFLGLNFFTLGDTNQSIIIAVIISVFLSGTALGAKWLKRTSGKFKTCIIWEMLLLLLFTVLITLFTYSPFSHYFVVSGQKEEIQTKLNASITQAENMYSAYEKYAESRAENYKGKLESVVTAKNINPREYQSFGFRNNGGSDGKQIQKKMFTMKADLFPSNFKEMKSADSNWLDKSRDIVNDWNPIGVVAVFNDIEQNTINSRDQLVILSEVKEINEDATDFVYEPPIIDVKKHFTTLDKPTALSILLAAVAYLLLLMTWIVSKRHTRYPGFKVLLGKTSGSISNDEVKL